MGLGNIGGYMDENWHGGQLDGDFFEHPDMGSIEESAGCPAKRRKTMTWNWKHDIIRELQRGLHAPEILAKYRPVIERFGNAREVRDFLDRNDCVIGWFVVDVSDFDDGFCYADMPVEMKSTNLFALNSDAVREVVSRSLKSCNDGSFDGFLNSDDSVEESCSYYDEATGLPCCDCCEGCCDDGDERLDGIAKVLLGRNWMSLGEYNGFGDRDGKMDFLVSVVRRHFRPQSRSNGDYCDVVSDYGVSQQELEAPSVRALDPVRVVGVRERRVDDIGDVAMPERVVIGRESRKSDFRKDVDVSRRVRSAEVGRMREQKLDDIGHIQQASKYAVAHELRKSDFRKDVDVSRRVRSAEVNAMREEKLDDIGHIQQASRYAVAHELRKSDFRKDVDVSGRVRSAEVNAMHEERLDDIGDIPDAKDVDIVREVRKSDFRKDVDVPDVEPVDVKQELSDRDYRDDFSFDEDPGELVIEDISDMEDDEFDYGELSEGDIDLDELAGEDAMEGELDIDSVPKKQEVSNRYDWSW